MIGQSLPMVDAARRVSGTIEYVLNLEPPGTLAAAVLRSDRPHARVVHIDTRAAARVSGVRAILTRADFEPRGRLDPFFGPVVRDQPIVAIDKVRYVGQPVAAVAAETPEEAAAAAAAVEVEYEDLPGVFSLDEALADDAPLVHERIGDSRIEGSFVTVVPVRDLRGNLGNRFQLRHGDVDAGFAAADEIFDDVFESPPVAHVTMEPHAALATFEDGRLSVWSSTQTPHAVRHELATIFDLPMTSVRVRVPSIGGGYGAKVYAKIEPLAAALAWKARRPVKLVLSRADTFLALTKHEARIRVRTGVKRDGELVAREVEACFNAGAYSDISPRLITNAGAATPGPYRIPNVAVQSLAVFTNQAPAGAFRGFGVTQAAWAYESQLDEIARALEIDPLELRLRNILGDGDRYATGETLKDFRLADVLQDAADHIGWSEPLDREPSPTRRRGRGVAGIMKASVTPSTSTAWLKLNTDGSVQVLASTVDMGQGSRTVLAQIAADAVGVDVSRVQVIDPDTDVTPFDQTTSSSRSTHSMGEAIRAAADDMYRQLQVLAERDNADAVARGPIGADIDLGELVTSSRAGNVLASGSYVTHGGLDPITGQGIGSVHWHQGAGAAEVEVDLETGKVTVLHYHSSVFAGRVINPLTARLQIQGSAIFGLGQALFEEMVFENGQLINGNLSDYTIPALHDLPARLTASLLEDGRAGDFHGIGETTLPPVMPAVANAIADAVGVRLRAAPMTPERVLEALERERSTTPSEAASAG